ncbi:hypothetical protein RJ639_023264 [Escallonia herrerae]|uniref:Uncharacterized protein n=1 Tax=Escallonia herrerae TaxID=1293975 RepID=A0AA88UZC6_9ASTE|nr:hypothetical protein RJ639_023264 [Escallonia herrerae]
MAKFSCSPFLLLLFVFSVAVMEAQAFRCTQFLNYDCEPCKCAQDCREKFNGDGNCHTFDKEHISCVCFYNC